MTTRKIICLLCSLMLVFVLAFAVTACGDEEVPENPTPDTPSTETACTHNWIEATCTAPKTCTLCNTTEGSAKGHATLAKHDLVAATHTTNGNIEYYSCPDCNTNFAGNSVETEILTAEDVVILAMGHTRATLVAGTPATHTDNGVRDYYYCDVCDAKFDGKAPDAAKFETEEDLVLLAMGHERAEKFEPCAATHTTNGYTATCWYCADCDKYFEGRAPEAEELDKEGLVILAMGHERAEKFEGTPATHTANGVHDYYYCDVCDAKFDDTTADAAKFETDEELVILAQGHIRAELVLGTPATHTANGTHSYYYCSVCDAKFDDRTADAAKFETEEELVILAQGHVRAELITPVAATHTANGYKELGYKYYYCFTCDEYFNGKAPEATIIDKEEVILLAMGHERAELVTGTPATHTENGVRDYYYCEECDAKFEGRAPEAAELSDDDLVLLAQGHVRAELIECVPATHTTNGNIEYYYCAVCDGNFVSRAPDAEQIPDEEVVILAQGHVRAEKITPVAPTHTANGFADIDIEYYYCASCDKYFEGVAPEALEIDAESVILLAMGHERAELVPGTPATHTANGIREYYYCAECDAKFEGRAPEAAELTDEELVILSMGHERAEFFEGTPATHTANGTHSYYYCSVCDAKFDGRTADAVEFETEESLVISAAGHVRAEKFEACAATHTTNGYTATCWYCADCDKYFEGRAPEAKELDKADLVILASGHERAELVTGTPATHTTNGIREYYYCEECDAKFDGRAPEAVELTDEELVLLSLGHERVEFFEGTPATHTANGTHSYYYCSICDAKFDGRTADAAKFETDDELVIFASGHIRAEKFEACAATHTENGYTAKCWYCADCDKYFEDRTAEAEELDVEELVILASGHIRAELVPAIPATHTTNGTREYYYCAECDAKFENRAPEAVEFTDEELVILAMGHERAELVPGTPATHTANGIREYYYCAECDAKFEGRAPEAAELTEAELVILASGHIRAEKLEAKPATHTQMGYQQTCWYCADCDKYFVTRAPDSAELEEEDVVILPSGHIRAEYVEAIPATHTTNGVIGYYYCEECNAKFDSRAPEAEKLFGADFIILATGHIRAEWVEAIPATHTTAGTAGYYYCADCDAKYESRDPSAVALTDEDLVVLPMGHIRAEKITPYAATHTENGYAALDYDYYYCSVCDKFFNGIAPEAVEIDKEEVIILPMGHDRAELVHGTPATHTAAGVRDYYYCSVCDAKFDGIAPEAVELSEEDLVLLPMGHTRAEKVAAVLPTANTDGHIAYYYCKECDAKFDGKAPEAKQLSDEDIKIVVMANFDGKSEAFEYIGDGTYSSKAESHSGLSWQTKGENSSYKVGTDADGKTYVLWNKGTADPQINFGGNISEKAYGSKVVTFAFSLAAEPDKKFNAFSVRMRTKLVDVLVDGEIQKKSQTVNVMTVNTKGEMYIGASATTECYVGTFGEDFKTLGLVVDFENAMIYGYDENGVKVCETALPIPAVFADADELYNALTKDIMNIYASGKDERSVRIQQIAICANNIFG